ncbi:MAG: hypothetical protein IPJ67_03175 [Candidatus Moraniibacteriota bacterium]|nr:MAG: hypothetical protein IPJ67_03175 [Candidatus Moranbacteria bacterium]
MESQKVKNEQKRTEARKKLFLAVFSMTLGQITKACEHTHIHRDTYYDWYSKDPQFASAVKAAGRESMGYFIEQAKNEIVIF